MWLGRFSLVIMAVHYILFLYVLPLCSKVLIWRLGAGLQPALAAILVFLICIPLCRLINWACPPLNGKPVPSDRPREAEKRSAGAFLKMLLGGILALSCVFLSMGAASCAYIATQPTKLMETQSASAPLSAMDERSDLRQYFTVSECTVTRVDVMVGTYVRENHGRLTVELHEAKTDEKLSSAEIAMEDFADNQYCAIQIPKTKLLGGTQYYLKFTAAYDTSEDMLTIYHTAEGTSTETTYAAIDGAAESRNLCVRLYGIPG